MARMIKGMGQTDLYPTENGDQSESIWGYGVYGPRRLGWSRSRPIYLVAVSYQLRFACKYIPQQAEGWGVRSRQIWVDHRNIAAEPTVGQRQLGFV